MTVGQFPHLVHFPGFFCYLPANNLCIVGNLDIQVAHNGHSPTRVRPVRPSPPSFRKKQMP